MWSKGSRKASAVERRSWVTPFQPLQQPAFSPRLIVHSLWAFCERALHSLSYYTPSPTCEHRKGARVHVCEAERMRREEKNYSMIYTSKPLEGHGHHVEYCGGIYWCGEGQVDYNNKGNRICFRVRLSAFAYTFCCFVFPSFIRLNPILELKPDRYSRRYSPITDVSYRHLCWLSADL